MTVVPLKLRRKMAIKKWGAGCGRGVRENGYLGQDVPARGRGGAYKQPRERYLSTMYPSTRSPHTMWLESPRLGLAITIRKKTPCGVIRCARYELGLGLQRLLTLFFTVFD